jgi:cell division septation protein DedD
MLIVEKHIKALLFENEYVIVPAFGGFITHYVEAEVNKVKSFISPPSKQIAFNSLLKQNDWLLVSSMVEKENITREEAITLIDEYVASIMAEINNDRYYNFEEVGIFSLNREYQIYFEPYHHINYLSQSFGLPEVAAKSLRQTPVKLNQLKDRLPEKLITKTKSSHKLVRLGVYAFSVFILGGSSMTFLYMNKGNKELSSFNPFYTSSEQHVLIDANDLPNPSLLYKKPNVALIEAEKLEEAIIEDQMKTQAQQQAITPIPAEAKTINIENPKLVTKEVAEPTSAKPKVTESAEGLLNEKTGKSYIIVGGFTVMENALQMQKILKSEGLKSHVIVPAGDIKLYRVTLGEFEKPEQAKNKLEGYKSFYGNSIWVLNY